MVVVLVLVLVFEIGFGKDVCEKHERTTTERRAPTLLTVNTDFFPTVVAAN